MKNKSYQEPFEHLEYNPRGTLGEVGKKMTVGTKTGTLGLTLPPNGFRKDSEACGIAGLIKISGLLKA